LTVIRELIWFKLIVVLIVQLKLNMQKD